MLWPKASPLDLDFGLCVWAKLFNKKTAFQLALKQKLNKWPVLFMML